MSHSRSTSSFLVIAVFVAAVWQAGPVHASEFTSLHSFIVPESNGPIGPVTIAKKDLTFGTTKDIVFGTTDPGDVYRLYPPVPSRGSWYFRLIHKKYSSQEGVNRTNIVMDDAGTIYGTRVGGGPASPYPYGLIYRLSPPAQRDGDWTYTIIYTFRGGAGGNAPEGSLAIDKNGNIYGATRYGGNKAAACQAVGEGKECGTIFRYSTMSGQFDILYRFQGGADGFEPASGVALAADGSIFGTTIESSATSNRVPERCGTIYKLTPQPAPASWTLTLLHRFAGDEVDGCLPAAPLAVDADGSVYGATASPKTVRGLETGPGTLFTFKPLPNGYSYSIIHTFAQPTGWHPYGGVAIGADGSLYGGTHLGGANGDGVMYVMQSPPLGSSTWSYRVLHDFNGADGRAPDTPTLSAAKVLYGSTFEGGSLQGLGKAQRNGIQARPVNGDLKQRPLLRTCAASKKLERGQELEDREQFRIDVRRSIAISFSF